MRHFALCILRVRREHLKKVVAISTFRSGHSLITCMTLSCFSSVSRSRPYPLFPSTVVTPIRLMVSRNHSALCFSSSKEASRVGTYSIDNASATFHDAHITVAVEPPDEFGRGPKYLRKPNGYESQRILATIHSLWRQVLYSRAFHAYTVFANIGNNTVGYSYRSARNVEKFVHASPSGRFCPCGVTMWALMIIKLLLITLFLFIP